MLFHQFYVYKNRDDKSCLLNKCPTQMHVNRQNTDASKAIILNVFTKEIFKEGKIS